MILVVDDESELRRTIRHLLLTEGFEAQTCAGGTEAFRLLEASEAAGQPFSLVVTDLKMPSGDGLTLIRRIRNRWNSLPVVVMTAFGDRATLRQILCLSCDGFLDKPFLPPELLSVIRRALAKTQGALESETNAWRDPDATVRVQHCPYVFGKYEVLGLIARGAMGSVYRARQLDLDRPVALKIVHSQSEATAFRREARAMARLHHPAIPIVHEVGRVEGVDFIAMELIEGTTLAKVIRKKGRLTDQATVAVLLPVAEALHAAHAAGILHRDVKPSNILIDKAARPSLVDFGIALWSKENDDCQDLQGTVPFMAPEYVESGLYDAACDTYALGLVFHCCLTGRVWAPACFPPHGPIDLKTVRRGARERPEPLASVAHATDPALAHMIDRSVASRRERLSLHELIRFLRSWSERQPNVQLAESPARAGQL